MFLTAVCRQKRKFNRVWPIITLRLLVTFMVTILYIPLTKFLLTAVDCQYIGTSTPTLDITGNTVGCFSFPHIILYVLSLVFALAFVPSALLFSIMYETPKFVSLFL